MGFSKTEVPAKGLSIALGPPASVEKSSVATASKSTPAMALAAGPEL